MKKNMMKSSICLALVLVLVMSLAGCSGNAGTEEGSETAGETVKIAVMAPLTGNLANIGEQFKQGVELKAKQINEAGGVNGKKVEIEYFDDKGDAKEAANIAQLIVNDEDIVAVVGSYTSSVCFAATPIFDKVGLSMVTPSASNPDLTKNNKVMFMMWTGFNVYAPMIADLAITELDGKDIAVIYAYNDWGIGVKDYFVERAKQLGGNIVAEEMAYDGDKDFKTQLTNIKSKNPDTLVILTYYAEGAIIVQQAKALGIDVQYVASGTFIEDQFLEMAGEYAEGMYAINEFVADDPRPSVQEFVQAYKEEFNGELPGNYQGNAYDALGAIIHAYENSGETREKVNEGLHNLQDYQGISGPLTFKDQEIVKPQVFVQLKDGVWSYYKEASIQ
ncbi:MAG: ABC transporter substrate-binding protein [Clostridia bacterium]|jgi:branched-chain amino acid transport system substrate-binding protein|nr:ABC transporter substrate-binding protein [Clostridiales bacterium]